MKRLVLSICLCCLVAIFCGGCTIYNKKDESNPEDQGTTTTLGWTGLAGAKVTTKF